MHLRFMAFIVAILVAAFGIGIGSATAQTATGDAPQADAAKGDPRAKTGGAQTLDDILARQRGEKIDDRFRRDATGRTVPSAAMPGQLGTLGITSDSEVYRALRYGSADVKVSARGPATDVIIQDGGMAWLNFRSGPLLVYGGYTLLAMLVVIALFYLLRGRIRIDGEKTGRTVIRFNGFERFGHWLLAISFILLGITGILSLVGRMFILPLIGKDAFATIALASKWVHNNVAWAFMLGLVWIIVTWIADNIPNRLDLNWLAKGGGLFSKGVHPPARKFNAGQKVIFWSVVVLGISISVSGLALLFPFQITMFAPTFEMLNATGLPQLLGFGELPTVLAPHHEMQLSQLWHAIIAFAFIAVVLAHIYIGSLGMEGAFDAVGSGEVEVQWAKEHHSLWYESVRDAEKAEPTRTTAGAPAE